MNKSIFYKRNSFFFALAIIFVSITAVLDLFIAYIMQLLIDAANTGSSLEILRLPVILTISYVLIYGLMLWGFRYTKSRFIKNAISAYRKEAFKLTLRKRHNAFANESITDLLSALSNDTTIIEDQLLMASFQIINSLIWLLGSLIFMIWYSWKLSIVVILLSLTSLFTSVIFSKKLSALTISISDYNASLLARLKDLLLGFPEIKSFRAETQAQNLFDISNDDVEEKKHRRRLKVGLLDTISQSIGSVAHIGVFIAGTVFAIKGDMTAGTVVAFVQLMNYFLGPIQQLPTMYANRRSALALIKKLSQKLECADEEGLVDIPLISSSIDVQNFAFAYEGERNVLKDISLSFQKGRSYAIIGTSGSGKSTLLNALIGSYSNYDGTINYDGVPIDILSFSSIVNNVSIVRQEVFIFNGSLLDNITMYNAFDSSDIDNAIHVAGLDTLVEEKGLNYPCGENGSNLSGGERQRISIARAVLKQAPVIMMDEATSALDPNTTRDIMLSILSMEDTAKIIVTHKLDKDVLRRFDEVVLLHNGRVCHGTYSELLEDNEYFTAMVSLSSVD